MNLSCQAFSCNLRAIPFFSAAFIRKSLAIYYVLKNNTLDRLCVGILYTAMFFNAVSMHKVELSRRHFYKGDIEVPYWNDF